MCPDIKSLVGELEQAEDAISSRTARVTIPREYIILLEGLQKHTHSSLKKTELTVTIKANGIL